MGMTFGWFSEAAIRDSSRNRARKISSLASSGASTFSAITLPRRGFSAWYTTLIPPRPRTARSRKPANSSPTMGSSVTTLSLPQRRRWSLNRTAPLTTPLVRVGIRQDEHTRTVAVNADLLTLLWAGIRAQRETETRHKPHHGYSMPRNNPNGVSVNPTAELAEVLRTCRIQAISRLLSPKRLRAEHPARRFARRLAGMRGHQSGHGNSPAGNGRPAEPRSPRRWW